MNMARFSLILLAALAVSTPALALADNSAQSFVEAEHVKLATLLTQPASDARDTQVTQALETMVDYDELTRRAFGQPCPAEVPSCKNHWGDLTDAQKNELKGLLKQLVEKNYRKNLIKMLDYNITYKDPREIGGDAKIRTEAKPKAKPRDASVNVDYVVHASNNTFRVVDIITNGSSLTKNYYDQFHRMMTTPGQGYPYIVQKLNEKVAKPQQ